MKITKFIAAVALAGSIGSARADLINYGSYFLDTTTGLEWLNNTPLASQSYNSVLSGYGGYTTSGWRFATGDELSSLVSQYVGLLGDLNSSNSWTHLDSSQGAYSNAYNLIELMGINVSFGNPPDSRSTAQSYTDGNFFGIATQGWYDDRTANGTVGIFDLAAYNETGKAPWAMTQIIPDFNSSNDFHGSNVSAILVKDSVLTIPLPPTALLMASALGILCLTRRKLKDS
jgi:hypothetical protein